jgi:hypothetical protein
MMLKKPEQFFKPKISKDSLSSKLSNSFISNSGKSSSSIGSNRLKQLGGRISIFGFENVFPPIKYHSWESKYNKSLTRQKIPIKDTYIQPKRLIAYANESITTEDECYPALIPADDLHIEKPIIHRQKKSSCKLYYFCISILTCKINISVPSIVRYVRDNDVISSELFVRQILTKKSPVYRLKVETKTLPIINNTKNRNSASTIRRSSSGLTMETIHEEIHECDSSDSCFCDFSSSNFFSSEIYSITAFTF